ncbi:/ infB / Translation initiation factor IF-2 /:184455 Forward [Candidatus Hepatoplasma crinochetorum]|uniref:Translation initiation factor IF-2 n=1 Tax=Candidatus Hepatoplasma crinochetorum TaxID=295596 RepID=A0A0G7ZM99_9MOLU|nr:/ infB / Translation initiation factor IF-2 /:184455 Forward [Candidatus Hepatoplasma crinochetorum]
MAKKTKNKKNNIYKYSLDKFFVERLSFKDNKLKFGTNTYLNELARILGLNPYKIKKKLGLDLKINDHILDDDQIAEIALSNNIEFEKVDDVSPENIILKINDLIENYKNWPKEVIIKKRTPIVTIMGHVDHGKTTLLDTIRNTNFTEKEAGGITQKIGAYQIIWKDNKITFIDTPGHEAFTEMRANGSKVTDLCVIVVSANDSLMKQTKESIDHARAANVPIIIAINKIDIPGHDRKKILNDLADYGVISEELGGDVPVVEISALKNQNIDQLLDTIILLTDLLNLKTAFNILSSGTVIESNIHKGRGNLVTVIVKNGILRIGDNIILDDKLITVKGLKDENQNPISEAYPGQPIEIYGAGFSPLAGSNFVAVSDLKLANKIVNVFHSSKLNALRNSNNKLITRENLFQRLSDQKKRIFNLILKVDSVNSLSAIKNQINLLNDDDLIIKIIHEDVGEVTNSDIVLADASKAIIYQFNFKTPNNLQSLIKSRDVLVLNFDIIYRLFEDIKEKISLTAKKEPVKKIIGKGEIIKKFVFSKVGAISGTKITDGFVKRNSKVDIYRNKKLIYETEIKSLMIEKNNVNEVKKGQECGITFKNFNDFLENDNLEFFEIEN